MELKSTELHQNVLVGSTKIISSESMNTVLYYCTINTTPP